MKVVKFGGSNLKKREDISKLVKVIKGYNKPLIIVISALYGMTDTIISTIENVHKDFHSIDQLQQTLLKAHKAILSDYLNETNDIQKTFSELEKRVEEMKRFLL